MVFYKHLSWCPQVDDSLREYEIKFQFQNIWGHEIYVQNHIQSYVFEHHF